MAKYKPTVNDHDSRIHKVLWTNEEIDGDDDKKISLESESVLLEGVHCKDPGKPQMPRAFR